MQLINTNNLLKISNKIKILVCKILKINFDFPYKSFSIRLPPGHMLPEYKMSHPKYDSFLPHLSKYVLPSETIIDVGANVGDTLAGMVEKNSIAKYICIEADDNFFGKLEYNVCKIKEAIPSLNVQTIKALIGKKISGVSLQGKGGTKAAVMNSQGGLESLSLDEIIHNESIVRILKSDVDGFDYDVLDSSMSIITNQKPILFFECQYWVEYQKNGFFNTFKILESIGYRDWTVFDNFGCVVIRTDNLNTIGQLVNYVWQQNIGNATRTIHYYDIMSAQQIDSSLIDNALLDYSSQT